MEELQEQGLLTTDYRGEPLEDGLQRYTEASATAEQLAEALHETDFPLDHPAHGEAPGERGPASAYYYLALLAAGLQQQGIAYPLEAYRIYRFLTRCAGETRTAPTLLKDAGVGLQSDVDVRRLTQSSFTAGQLAAVLGTAYSAVGHLAYKEAPDA